MQTLHGDTLEDDYFWMRERDNPKVRAFLEAENAYTDAFMKPTEPLQKTLYDEMLGRIKETDLSVPYRDGGWFYYSRTEKGKQYPIYCRKKGSLEAPEEVYLDVNALAEGREVHGRRGAQRQRRRQPARLHDRQHGVPRLHAPRQGPDDGQALPRARRRGSPRSPGPPTTRRSSTRRRIPPSGRIRLYRHTLGTDPATDTLLYEEKDEMFRVFAGRSRSRAVIFVGVRLAHVERVALAPGRPADGGPAHDLAAREGPRVRRGPPRRPLLHPRRTRAAATSASSRRRCPTPARRTGRSCCPAATTSCSRTSTSSPTTASSPSARTACPRLRDHGPEDRARPTASTFPRRSTPPTSRTTPSSTRTTLRFDYESFTTPPSVYDFDMATKQRKLLKQNEVLGGYDPSRYTSERRYATAADGTKIPISVVYRKGFVADGKAPMLLTAYGSYGAPSDAEFNSNRRQPARPRRRLCHRPHPRRRRPRQEVARPGPDDVEEEHLHRLHRRRRGARSPTSTPRRIASSSRAARPAACSWAPSRTCGPDLFKAVIARVPFVDVINTMLDESLPADRRRVRGVGQSARSRSSTTT